MTQSNGVGSGVSDVVKVGPGPGGLDRVLVETPAARAELVLQGAQLLRWKPAHAVEDVLFVSSKSAFALGKAIRGGVPICYPWFGDAPGGVGSGRPAHGIARISPWRLVEATRDADDVRLLLELAASPGDLSSAGLAGTRTRLDVRIGATLSMELIIDVDPTRGPLTCEAALHTYYRVGDVQRVRIQGLGATEYISKVAGNARIREGPSELWLSSETDRVYQNTNSTVRIEDDVLGRTITIDKHGSASTVLWNPWEKHGTEKIGLAMDEWKKFVCVETGAIGENAMQVPPGSTARIGMKIEVR